MAIKIPKKFKADDALSYLDFRKYFNVDALWQKVTRVAKAAGLKAIYAVMLLYYTSIDPGTPWKAKATIYGALGYFILPLDFIPDTLPLVGFSDDMAALIAALKAVWMYITPAVRNRAFEKVRSWFPDVRHEDLKNLF